MRTFVRVRRVGVAPSVVPHVQADLDGLLAQLVVPARWVRSSGRWRPRLDGHHVRHDPSLGAFKVYVDQPSRGGGTRWRLYFRAELEEGELVVEVLRCRREH